MVRASIPTEPTAEPALVIAPHPDDETFGCGGTIALKRQQGVPVTIIFLTSGDASHPDEDPIELSRKRKAEALAATALLGVPADEVIFLDAPDGRLASMAPDARSAIVRRLADLLTEKRPREIYVPHRHDPHPDHIAANSITRQAITQASADVTLMEYPIWLLWWAPLNLPAAQLHLQGARRITLGNRATAIKANAINAYRTQLPGMPWKFMTQFTGGFELFFCPDPR
jgi:LmbE family N-acetylglucosaminyl deacetylase